MVDESNKQPFRVSLTFKEFRLLREFVAGHTGDFPEDFTEQELKRFRRKFNVDE